MAQSLDPRYGHTKRRDSDITVNQTSTSTMDFKSTEARINIQDDVGNEMTDSGDHSDYNEDISSMTSNTTSMESKNSTSGYGGTNSNDEADTVAKQFSLLNDDPVLAIMKGLQQRNQDTPDIKEGQKCRIGKRNMTQTKRALFQQDDKCAEYSFHMQTNETDQPEKEGINMLAMTHQLEDDDSSDSSETRILPIPKGFSNKTYCNGNKTTVLGASSMSFSTGTTFEVESSKHLSVQLSPSKSLLISMIAPDHLDESAASEHPPHSFNPFQAQYLVDRPPYFGLNARLYSIAPQREWDDIFNEGFRSETFVSDTLKDEYAGKVDMWRRDGATLREAAARLEDSCINDELHIEPVETTDMTHLKRLNLKDLKQPVQPPGKSAYINENGVISLLQRAAPCRSLLCSDDSCKKGRELVHVIESALTSGCGLVSPYAYFLLQVLDTHSRHCEEPCCALPYCQYLHAASKMGKKLEHTIVDLQLLIKYPFCNFDLMYVQTTCPTTMELLNTPKGECRENIVILKRFSQFGHYNPKMEDFLACSLDQQCNINPIILSKMHLNQLAVVYPLLKPLTHHQSLPKFLWAVPMGNHKSYMVDSSVFKYYGMPLELYLLREKGCIPLNRWKILCGQLLDVLIYLDKKSVLFLNWTGCSVQLCENDGEEVRLVLTDFSAAVALTVYPGSGNELAKETSELIRNLPPSVLPPDLLCGGPIDCTTALWGAGCLLYQMASGKPVYHDQRHLSLADLRDLVKQRAIERSSPICPTPMCRLDTTVANIIEACWQVEPSCRLSLSELRLFLTTDK